MLPENVGVVVSALSQVRIENRKGRSVVVVIPNGICEGIRVESLLVNVWAISVLRLSHIGSTGRSYLVFIIV